MLGSKTTLIADLVHGSIALSPMEKKLISTRAFNRLHNVLQNSTVYFTYPSNRTSRFSHSLGVTKLAGDLFRSALLNASKDLRSDFFKQAKEKITSIQQTDEFRKDKQYNISEGYRKLESPLHAVLSLSCPFYELMLPPGLSDDDTALYIALLQAVRFVAMLHDVGHPPFSHVTEHALQNIYNKLDKKNKQNSEDLTARESDTFNQLAEFLKRHKTGVFHEAVGFQISNALMVSLVQDLKSSGCSDQELYGAILIEHIALEILKNSDFYKSLHKIVASSLDADRLDYVQRDLIMSGLSREPFRPERLIQSYTLIASKSQSEPFQFLPSIRGLNNVEDFFYQRFQLYKYVIFHHRVIKFDGLMQACIEDLAEAYFSRNSLLPPPTELSELVLFSDVSALWQLLSLDVMSDAAQRENYYIQWDDAWLLGFLRREYFLLKKKRENDGATTKEVLEVRLEELLSNRKNYYALFKRAECFIEIDHSFADAIPDGFDWNPLAAKLGHDSIDERKQKLISEFETIAKYIQQLKKVAITESEKTRVVEANGYLTARIVGLLGESKGRVAFLYAAAARFKAKKADEGNEEILDIIVIQRNLNPGIKASFSLADNNNAAIEIGRLSRVADELLQGALMFPPFFVYFLLKNPSKFTNDEKLWRREFGRELWEAFYSFHLV